MTERSAPYISLIMMVKNGMPYLSQALASVAGQTYRNFELVVQDGGSTDGSLNVLAEFASRLSDGPRVVVESGPDAGIADAFNKAIDRCTGELIGSIDADNLLDPDCLRTIVERFSERPDAAAIYSAQRIIHADGRFSHHFRPAPFNALDLLDCRLVPPFGSSFFRASHAAGRLRADPALKTCADFNIWRNYFDTEVVMIPDVLASTRTSDASMTCRPETYPQICRDKIAGVEHFFAREDPSPVLRALKNRSVAGIYLWAAESVHAHPSGSALAKQFLARAEEVDPLHPRLEDTRLRVTAADEPSRSLQNRPSRKELIKEIFRATRSLLFG